MKKKLLWFFGILAAVALIATLIGPGIILNAVRQPEPAAEYAYSESFLTDNATSAQIVRQNYLELFYPTETAWREKTVADFTAAALGVLDAKLK